MSPLACSLLALAALLATADAIMPSRCAIKDYDVPASTNDKQITFKNIPFHPGGSIVKVHKSECRRRYGKRYKFGGVLRVTACNDKEEGDGNAYAPSIARVDKSSFNILCDDGCVDGGHVDILVDCEFLIYG